MVKDKILFHIISNIGRTITIIKRNTLTFFSSFSTVNFFTDDQIKNDTMKIWLEIERTSHDSIFLGQIEIVTRGLLCPIPLSFTLCYLLWPENLHVLFFSVVPTSTRSILNFSLNIFAVFPRFLYAIRWIRLARICDFDRSLNDFHLVSSPFLHLLNFQLLYPVKIELVYENTSPPGGICHPCETIQSVWVIVSRHGPTGPLVWWR